MKKQGVLPLTFIDSADYDRIQKDDRLTINSLEDLAPGTNVDVEIHHTDGKFETIQTAQSLTKEQIEWFQAGSALNLIRKAKNL